MSSEKAQGDFMAATGRSREEAKAFAKDMNSLVGTTAATGKSFDDIYRAGIQVAQQFGKTGAEGRALTSDFLAFSRVTRQDAAAAVDDFDGALDAWGEPAERARGLMDQLIASNQKYGTDAGPAALRAIKDMAPALQAMGADLDDAVSLLNLFEAAGIDASKAPLALNKAVQELKPGQGLDDLIAQIASVEDPLERAQLAAEIFGTRSGTGLANAIKPGIKGLDDYRLGVEEVAGTTERAADDMLTTGERIKNAFDGILAKARDFGTDLGPILSGAGALTSLVPAITDLWKKVGADEALKRVVGVVGAAAGSVYATGLKLGEKLTDWIKKAWEKVLSEPIGKAVQSAAGAAAGAAYAVGMKAFEILRSIVNTAWIAIGGDKILQAAAMAAGGKHGAAFAGGALLAIPIALAELGNMSWDALANFLGGWTREEIWEAAGGRGGKALAEGVQQGVYEYGPIDTGQMFGPPNPKDLQPWVDYGERIPQSVDEGIRRGAGRAEAERYVRGLEVMLEETWVRMRERAWGAGVDTPRAYGQGVASAYAEPVDAMTRLKELMKNTLSPVEKEAELIGIATHKKLAKALKDGRPEVRAEGQQIALDTIRELAKLNPQSEEIGHLSMKLLAGATASERPALQQALNQILATANAGLEDIPPAFDKAGRDSRTAFLGQIRLLKREVITDLDNFTRTVENRIRLGSPAKEGPWSRGGGPEAWMEDAGDRIPRALSRRLLAGVGRVRDASALLAGAVRSAVGEIDPTVAPLNGFSLARMPLGDLAYSTTQQVASSTTLRHEHSGTMRLELTAETLRIARELGYDERQLGTIVAEVGRRLFGTMPMPLAPGQGV